MTEGDEAEAGAQPTQPASRALWPQYGVGWLRLTEVHDLASAKRAAWRGAGVVLIPVMAHILHYIQLYRGVADTPLLATAIMTPGSIDLWPTILLDVAILLIAWRIASGKGYILAVLALIMNVGMIVAILVVDPLSLYAWVIAILLFCIVALPGIDGVRGTLAYRRLRREGAKG